MCCSVSMKLAAPSAVRVTTPAVFTEVTRHRSVRPASRSASNGARAAEQIEQRRARLLVVQSGDERAAVLAPTERLRSRAAPRAAASAARPPPPRAARCRGRARARRAASSASTKIGAGVPGGSRSASQGSTSVCKKAAAWPSAGAAASSATARAARRCSRCRRSRVAASASSALQKGSNQAVGSRAYARLVGGGRRPPGGQDSVDDEGRRVVAAVVVARGAHAKGRGRGRLRRARRRRQRVDEPIGEDDAPQRPMAA